MSGHCSGFQMISKDLQKGMVLRMVLKLCLLLMDSHISTSISQHHSTGRVGRMAGTDRRNSRPQGVREPEGTVLERESWSKSWVYMRKGKKSGKGLSWIHFSFNLWEKREESLYGQINFLFYPILAKFCEHSINYDKQPRD